MKRAILILTSLTSLILATSAQANDGPHLGRPQLSDNPADACLQVKTAYSIPDEDIAPGGVGTLVYSIRRHRPHRAGFRPVGEFPHLLTTTGDGIDETCIPWSEMFGGRRSDTGYRVVPQLVNVAHDSSAIGPTGKIHL